MYSDFPAWFAENFGLPTPKAFAQFLAKYPMGVENGFGPRLWPADRVMQETEDRGLVEKGVCLIGASDSISHILMRAKDGKVFLVSSRDNQNVDAWFADVQVFINLLNLE